MKLEPQNIYELNATDVAKDLSDTDIKRNFDVWKNSLCETIQGQKIIKSNTLTQQYILFRRVAGPNYNHK